MVVTATRRTVRVLFLVAGLFLSSVSLAHAESWALLIGIDQYPEESGVNRLKGADNDANALAQTLRDTLHIPGDHIKTLTSTGAVKPTKNAILRELNALKARIHPGDTVFVAYSGHGIESEGTPYLLPYDADITNTDLIRDTGLAESKFMDYLKTIPAKALILVFDMCRENVEKGKGIQKNTLTPAQMRGVEIAPPPASASGVAPKRPELVATFFACSPDGSSYEMPSQNRGYFSFYLEQGLRGFAADKNGQVSLSGLQAYLARTVPQAVTADRPGGAVQIPTSTIIGPLDGGGFVVVTVNVSTITGITTASARMQQALALVPELIAQATVTAKVAKEPVLALIEVWQAQRKTGDTQAATQTLIRAKQIADAIEDRIGKTHALIAIAQAQLIAEDVSGAKTTLLQAKQTATDISELSSADDALIIIAQWQAKSGDVEGAKQTLLQAKQAAIAVNKKDTTSLLDKYKALKGTAAAQASIGDVAGAKQTVTTIIQLHDQVEAMSYIAQWQAIAGDMEGAKQTLLQAKQAAKAETFPPYKVDALLAIAEAQAKSADVAGPKETLLQAKQAAMSINYPESPEIKANCLRDVAAAQVEAEDVAGAKQTLLQARHAATAVNEPEEKSLILHYIAQAQAKTGDVAGAKQTANSITDFYDKASALSDIAAAQAEAGDVAGAKQTIMPISYLLSKASALSAIAVAQAKSGDITGAKQTVITIDSEDYKIAVLSAIATAQTTAGDFAGAKSTMEEIRDAGEKAIALSHLASAILDAAKKESEAAQKQNIPPAPALTPPAKQSYFKEKL